jgi:hypothetical protein
VVDGNDPKEATSDVENQQHRSPETWMERMLDATSKALRQRQKGRKKKPCCCCCDGCQHQVNSNIHPVYARWDNANSCFVPCYRDKAYVFAKPPFYYRYMGLNDLESASYSWILVVFVLLVFVVLLSTDSYNSHWHYHTAFDSNSPAMAGWVLLIACGGLLVISLFAWWIYLLCTANSPDT